MLEEVLDDGQPIVAGSEVQRSGMASIQVAAIDQLRLRRAGAENAPNVVQVAGFGRFQQLIIQIGRRNRCRH